MSTAGRRHICIKRLLFYRPRVSNSAQPFSGLWRALDGENRIRVKLCHYSVVTSCRTILFVRTPCDRGSWGRKKNPLFENCEDAILNLFLSLQISTMRVGEVVFLVIARHQSDARVRASLFCFCILIKMSRYPTVRVTFERRYALPQLWRGLEREVIIAFKEEFEEKSGRIRTHLR